MRKKYLLFCMLKLNNLSYRQIFRSNNNIDELSNNKINSEVKPSDIKFFGNRGDYVSIRAPIWHLKTNGEIL